MDKEKVNQEAAKEFEKLIAEMTATEAGKLKEMSHEEILNYAATSRAYLSYSFILLNYTGNTLAAMQLQQLAIVEALKEIADEKTFDDLAKGLDKDLSNSIDGIKYMTSKYSC